MIETVQLSLSVVGQSKYMISKNQNSPFEQSKNQDISLWPIFSAQLKGFLVFSRSWSWAEKSSSDEEQELTWKQRLLQKNWKKKITTSDWEPFMNKTSTYWICSSRFQTTFISVLIFFSQNDFRKIFPSQSY